MKRKENKKLLEMPVEPKAAKSRFADMMAKVDKLG